MEHLDLSVIAEKSKIRALIDRDRESDSSRAKFLRKCEQLGIPVTRLNRRAIENYFSVEALRTVFGTRLPPEFSAVNPDQRLDDQLGFGAKGKNRAIARAMSLTDIDGTDLLSFIEGVVVELQQGHA